jgi:hypothetical protein
MSWISDKRSGHGDGAAECGAAEHCGRASFQFAHTNRLSITHGPLRLLDSIRSRPQRLEHHGCTPEKVFVRTRKGSDTIALNVNGAHSRTVHRRRGRSPRLSKCCRW